LTSLIISQWPFLSVTHALSFPRKEKKKRREEKRREEKERDQILEICICEFIESKDIFGSGLDIGKK